MNVANTLGVSTLLLGATFLLVVPDANAYFVNRALAVNASGACQSALPVFDVQIRKRPKAVQNEGTSPAYVTCTYYSQGGYGYEDNPATLTLYVSINDGVADTLTCTGVSGAHGDDPFTPFVVKTVDIPADTGMAYMFWSPSDFGPGTRMPSPFVSVSCNLNPGVGINQAYVGYTQEIPF